MSVFSKVIIILKFIFQFWHLKLYQNTFFCKLHSFVNEFGENLPFLRNGCELNNKINFLKIAGKICLKKLIKNRKNKFYISEK